MTLVVPGTERESMLAHAREVVPEEGCGLLGGTRGDEHSAVAGVHPAANVAPAPETTYAIDPEEQLAAMEAVEEAGRDVVGFYHSHPRGPDEPSPTDRARASWPGYSYVIVSLAGETPSVGSWRWTGERFEREQVRSE